jgi:hypothetical protein
MTTLVPNCQGRRWTKYDQVVSPEGQGYEARSENLRSGDAGASSWDLLHAENEDINVVYLKGMSVDSGWRVLRRSRHKEHNVY